MVKVYAPDRDYRGISAGVEFTGGVADVDPTEHPGAMAYFRRSGYGIGNPPPVRVAEKSGSYEPVPASVVVGTELRDAAVDPQPQDFLPPINAGKADPHGPLVVSPGLHGVGPAPIRPGEVYVDDTDRQQAEETELAERVLVKGEPATIVSGIGKDGDVSDATLQDAGVPRRNATKADWVAFAVSQGMDRDEAEDMTRDALAGRHG